MQAINFDYLWEYSIQSAAHNALDRVPQSMITKYEISIRRDSAFKKNFQEAYNEYRFFLRENFFLTEETEYKLIDFHKVSACIVGAAIKNRLIQYRIAVDIPEEVFLANYTAAFLAGIHTLYLLRIAKYKINIKENNKATAARDKELLKLLERQKSYIFPKTNVGHPLYLDGCSKMLALNSVHKIEFDILGCANILFWIEQFNLDHIYHMRRVE